MALYFRKRTEDEEEVDQMIEDICGDTEPLVSICGDTEPLVSSHLSIHTINLSRGM